MAFGDVRGTLTGGNNSIPASFATTAGSIAVSVGDLILTIVGQQTALTVTACGDNLHGGSTHSAVNAGSDAGAATGRAFWHRVTTAGTLTTVTAVCTGSTNDGSIAVVVLEGPFRATPLDANPANVTNDVTTPYTGPATGTLAQADEYIAAFYAKDGNSSLTGSNPNTLRVNQNQSANIATGIGGYVVSATTTQSPAWTGTAPTVDVLITASFRKDTGVAVGSASGTGDAAGVGASTAASVGAASGTGASSVVGAALFNGVGNAAGVGAAAAVGEGIVSANKIVLSFAELAGFLEDAGNVGNAAGVGTAAAVGAATTNAVGSARGRASVPGVHFDGSTFVECSSLTATDNEFMSISIFLRTTDDVSNQFILNLGSTVVEFDITAGSNINYLCDPGPGSISVQPTFQVTTEKFVHIIACVDMGATRRGQMLIDGVDRGGFFSFGSGAQVFPANGKVATIGRANNGAQPFTGDIAELWFAPGVNLLDGSGNIDSATLAKFRDAAGKPVFLGENGQVPTGTAPAVYLSGDASTFATNRGTGGSFTTTGTLTNALDGPGTEGIGAALANSVGSAAGVGAASAVGQSIFNAVGNAAGVGAAAAVSEAGASVGAAAGIGAAAAVGASTAAGVGSATGTGAAAAVGASTAASVGNAAGTGAASAVGQSIFNAVGNAAGTGTATGIADSGAASGNAAGVGAAAAVGASTAASSASATGTGAASAVGASTAASAGSAAGTGAASAVGRAIFNGVGNAAGTGAAAATSSVIFNAVGNASGTGAAAAVGNALKPAVGNAAGTGAAAATGVTAAVGTGSASGTGAASAVSSLIISAIGSAAGFGIALGVGAQIGTTTRRRKTYGASTEFQGAARSKNTGEDQARVSNKGDNPRRPRDTGRNKR